MSIKWPKEWEQKGWPTINTKGPAIIDLEPRNWASLIDIYRHTTGLRFTVICEQLGGPPAKTLDRSLEHADRFILEYRSIHGCNPTSKSSKMAENWNAWLRNNHSSSLSKRCTELGLPPTRILGRSLEGVDRFILEYRSTYGSNPTSGSSKEAKSWNKWLAHNHNSSLPKRCVELGLAGSTPKRTLKDVDKFIIAYRAKHGRSPSVVSSKEARNWNAWLRHNHNSSLALRCHKLRLSPTYNLNRTIEEADRFILNYRSKHGWCPSVGSSKEAQNWDGWLRRNYESSLFIRAKELGLC